MLSSEQAFNLLLTCAGGLVGVVSGLATSICSKWLNTPKLELSLEFDRIVGSELPVFPIGNTPEGTTIEARYARLKIVNRGRQVARGCRVYLTDVEGIRTDGSLARTWYNNTLRLHWEYEGQGPLHGGIDLPKGLPYYLDVVFSRKDLRRFEPNLAAQSPRFYDLLSEYDAYVLAVMLVADNADERTFRVKLTRGDGWDTFTLEAYKR